MPPPHFCLKVVCKKKGGGSLKAVQACWMAWKLPKRFTEAYKQGSLARQTQPINPSTDRFDTESDPHWGWLGLTCKKNNKWQATFPDCVSQLLSTSFYWHTWGTVDSVVLSCLVHVCALFLTMQTGLLTRFFFLYTGLVLTLCMQKSFTHHRLINMEIKFISQRSANPRIYQWSDLHR